MILALSGRRIDALMVGRGVTWLVSSAACGADLIALSEAGKLGIRRKVVLPFDPAKFRESSVVDRPGEWGDLYDQITRELVATDEVVIVQARDGNDPFRATCQEILDEAADIGKQRHQEVGAVMVWDGNVRETPDYTSEFGEDARARGMKIFEVSTV
jgi:hypothetical protein